VRKVNEKDLEVGNVILFGDVKLLITDINRESSHPYKFINLLTGEKYGNNWNLGNEEIYVMESNQGVSMLSNVKEYFQKNRDVVFTLILCILVDKFVFNGAFTAKIKNTIDKLLDDTHKRITK
jgi:hypothetical protein